MIKIPLFSIPCPSVEAIEEPRFMERDSSLVLSMVLANKESDRNIEIVFTKFRAMQWRAEGHCQTWHIEGTYDTLCEIKQSKWVAELHAATLPEFETHWVMHHFMIYLDSFGCLEVIAESAKVIESPA